MTGKSRKEQLQEMLAEEPRDEFLRYGLAMEFVSEGNDEEAARCFQAMMQEGLHYVPAYLQAGQALNRLGRIDEARTIFQQGIALAQRKGEAHAAGEMQGFLEALE
jgi:Tfp pilus assembly protein PilF